MFSTSNLTQNLFIKTALRTYLLKQLTIMKVRMLQQQFVKNMCETIFKTLHIHNMQVRLYLLSLLYSKSVNLVDYTYNIYISLYVIGIFKGNFACTHI